MFTRGGNRSTHDNHIRPTQAPRLSGRSVQFRWRGDGMHSRHACNGTRLPLYSVAYSSSRTADAIARGQQRKKQALRRVRAHDTGRWAHDSGRRARGKGKRNRRRTPAANIGHRGLFPRRPCPSFELALMKCSLTSRGRVSSAPCARRVRRSRVFDPECGSANAGYCP